MRINLFAGPGSGKSTTAARIFAQLKERQVSVEHVGEYVKAWAYKKQQIKKWDQIYLFGKQQQYEYRYLSAGVKNIVTDSPCFLSVVYSLFYGKQTAENIASALAMLCKEYDQDHPCLNIFLNRGDKPYVQEGRYQSYESAQQVDKFMKDTLWKYNKPFVEIDYKDKDAVLETVLKAVEK